MKFSDKVSSRLLGLMFEEVHKEMKRSNFKYVRIERPENANRRSIDIIAWSQDDSKKRIHIKITLDTTQVTKDELEDLKAMSKATGSKPIIISEFERKIDLHDEVIYMKGDVPAINPSTLSRLLEKSKDLYIVSKRGEFIVMISGERMKKKREELGYSLGEIAERLGVSRKAVYEYERNSFGVKIDSAEELLDILGEDIAEPFDIFSHEASAEPSLLQPTCKTELEVQKALRGLSADVYSMRKTFFDMAIRIKGRGILIGYERPSSSLKLSEKAEEFAKISELKDLKKIIIIKGNNLELSSDTQADLDLLTEDQIREALRNII